MERTWEVTLVPLVLLTDVDNDGIAAFDQLAGADCVDLVDLALHLRQQLSVRRHSYPKCSDAEAPF